VLADVAFSTSVLVGAAAATLYFGRYEAPSPPQAMFQPRAPRISAALLELRY
jgi:hypothetical protein